MEAKARTDLQEALHLCRKAFFTVGWFSLCINLLMLVPAFYMLQVYDRVVSSGSLSTLSMLTLIAVLLLTTMGALEWVRSQVLVRVSSRLDALLGDRLYEEQGSACPFVCLVHQNDGGRVQLQAAPHNDPGIDRSTADRAPEQPLEGDQGVLGGEEQAGEVFVALPGELQATVLAHLFRGGQRIALDKAGLQQRQRPVNGALLARGERDGWVYFRVSSHSGLRISKGM